MPDVEQNLTAIRERIAGAAARAGRSAEDVELVAVSKKIPAEAVLAAWEAGQTVFAESRVQEAAVKIAELSGALRWQFIGHLQTNKVRRALPLFELFHGFEHLQQDPRIRGPVPHA